MNFYNNGIMDADKLFNILSPLYELSENELTKKVEELKNAFIANEPISHWKSNKIRCSGLRGYALKGIDIPFWMDGTLGLRSSERSNTKKIIFLGQEPFRTKESFSKKELNIIDDVEVSNPFGFHLSNLNGKLPQKQYGLILDLRS